ncbi:MAG: TlpA disulfide reductase family protein [Steroidobacteraceae bacterium]
MLLSTLLLAGLVALLAPRASAAGDPLDLAALRGKVVYLDFWASWCGPCRQSFPWMQDLQRELGPGGLVIVAVNVDHERADAEDFLRRFAPNFRIVYDPDGVIAQRYDVHGMPTSVLIDRDGRQHAVHAGFRLKDRETRAQELRALVGAPVGAARH